jgi:hypothetical protein
MTKPPGNKLFEIATEFDAVDFPTTPVGCRCSSRQDVSTDDGDAQDVVYPAVQALPILDTSSEDKKHRSRASSIR